MLFPSFLLSLLPLLSIQEIGISKKRSPREAVMDSIIEKEICHARDIVKQYVVEDT